MSELTLAKKLKLKPGVKAAVINPPEHYMEELQHDAEILAVLH